MTATTFAASIKKGIRVVANLGSLKEPAYYSGLVESVSKTGMVKLAFDDGDTATLKAAKSKTGIVGLAISKARKSEISSDVLSDWLLPDSNPPKVNGVHKQAPKSGDAVVLLAVDRKNLMLETETVLAQIVRNTGADVKQLAAARATKKVFGGKELTKDEIKAMVDAILAKSKDEASTLLVMTTTVEGKEATSHWRFKYPASKDSRPKAGGKLLLSKLSDNELTQVHSWYYTLSPVRTLKGKHKLVRPEIKVDYSAEGMGPVTRRLKTDVLHAAGVRSGVYHGVLKVWIPTGYEAEADQLVAEEKAASGMIKDQPAKPAPKKQPSVAAISAKLGTKLAGTANGAKKPVGKAKPSAAKGK